AAPLWSAHTPEAHAGPAHLAVPEGHVVGILVAGDRRDLGDRLSVLEYPLHEVGGRLIGGKIGEAVLALPQEQVSVIALPACSKGRPLTEHADVPFARHHVGGPTFQPRPGGDT